MGLIDIIKGNQNKTEINQLDAAELQLALLILKQSTVRGEQVEIFYNMVIKLQNQYLELTKNQK